MGASTVHSSVNERTNRRATLSWSLGLPVLAALTLACSDPETSIEGDLAGSQGAVEGELPA